MAQHLIHPHRHFEAERRRHRVLAVRAPGQHHVRAAFRQIRHRPQRRADQAQENVVRLPENEQIAGLHDVLRRRPPMDPAAMRFADDAGEFPDERNNGVTGPHKRLIDPHAVHQMQMRLLRNRHRGILRDNPQIRLRAGQRRFHVHPALPAIFELVQRPDARVRDLQSGGSFIAHGPNSFCSIFPPTNPKLARVNRGVSCHGCRNLSCGIEDRRSDAV